MEQFMPFVWLLISIILILLELSTSQLVCIWFVVGGLVTALCSATFLKEYILLQVILFIVVSVVTLILTKPLVKKLKFNKKTPTNSDRFIGLKGVVIQDISSEKSTGLIEVDSSKWSARATDGSDILAGTTVIVDSIKGVKLMVTPVSNSESEE